MTELIVLRETPFRPVPSTSAAPLGNLHEGEEVVGTGEAADNFVRVEVFRVAGSAVKGWVTKDDVGPRDAASRPLLDPTEFVQSCIMVEQEFNLRATTPPWMVVADFLVARAVIETGMVNAGTLVAGTDAIGPLQVTSAEWQAWLDNKTPQDNFTARDRDGWLSQIWGAGFKMHADGKKISQLKRGEGGVDTTDPFIPSYLDLFIAYLTGKPEAAVAIRDADEGGQRDKKIDVILRVSLPADQLEKLFAARAAYLGTIAAPKTVGEFITVAETKLNEGLKQALELIAQHAPDALPAIKQGEAPWFDVALKEAQVVVDGANPAHKNIIVNYFKSTDFHPSEVHAWCGAFAAHCLKHCDNPAAAASVPRNAERAANWNGWGSRLPVEVGKIPQGAVVVFSPFTGTGSSGHIGFFVKFLDDAGKRVEILGGNQGNKLVKTSFPASKIVHVGWLDLQPTHFQEQFSGPASGTKISKRAFDLIVGFEVTSPAHYEARLRHPEWPGESSGVTVGIGYDVGQTPRDTFVSDWAGVIAPSMIAALGSAIGITGPDARAHAVRLRDAVDISFDQAIKVHADKVVPRWVGKVQKALPNTDRLNDDCLGALVSLVFNRGPSFTRTEDRFREMRNIKAHMESKRFERIPQEIRNMKRLWPGTPGLLRRRDDEAKFFEEGLRAAPPPTS
jgi:hypothetical protein